MPCGVSYSPWSRTQGHPLSGLGGLQLASAWIRKRHPFGGTARQGDFVWRKSNPFLRWLGFRLPLTHLASIHYTWRPCGFYLITFIFFSCCFPTFLSANWPTFLNKADMFSLYPFLCLLLLTTHYSFKASARSHLKTPAYLASAVVIRLAFTCLKTHTYMTGSSKSHLPYRTVSF